MNIIASWIKRFLMPCQRHLRYQIASTKSNINLRDMLLVWLYGQYIFALLVDCLFLLNQNQNLTIEYKFFFHFSFFVGCCCCVCLLKIKRRTENWAKTKNHNSNSEMNLPFSMSNLNISSLNTTSIASANNRQTFYFYFDKFSESWLNECTEWVWAFGCSNTGWCIRTVCI